MDTIKVQTQLYHDLYYSSWFGIGSLSGLLATWPGSLTLHFLFRKSKLAATHGLYTILVRLFLHSQPSLGPWRERGKLQDRPLTSLALMWPTPVAFTCIKYMDSFPGDSQSLEQSAGLGSSLLTECCNIRLAYSHKFLFHLSSSYAHARFFQASFSLQPSRRNSPTRWFFPGIPSSCNSI